MRSRYPQDVRNVEDAWWMLEHPTLASRIAAAPGKLWHDFVRQPVADFRDLARYFADNPNADITPEVAAKAMNAAGVAMTGTIPGLAGRPSRTVLSAGGARPSWTDPGWIAQRHPTGRGFGNVYDPANAYDLRINWDAMRSDPAFWASAAAKARALIPNLTDAERAGSDDEVMRALHRHMVENMLYLHDRQHPYVRARAAGWYPGANTISQRVLGAAYGLPASTSAGMLAALSPQMDWNINIELARRTADILSKRGNETFTPAMMDTAQRIYSKIITPNDKGIIRDATLLDRLAGRRLNDLPVDDQAAFLRAWDDTYPEAQALRGDPTGTAFGCGRRRATRWDLPPPGRARSPAGHRAICATSQRPSPCSGAAATCRPSAD